MSSALIPILTTASLWCTGFYSSVSELCQWDLLIMISIRSVTAHNFNLMINLIIKWTCSQMISFSSYIKVLQSSIQNPFSKYLVNLFCCKHYTNVLQRRRKSGWDAKDSGVFCWWISLMKWGAGRQRGLLGVLFSILLHERRSSPSQLPASGLVICYCPSFMGQSTWTDSHS